MGQSYNQYISQYLEGLARGVFDTHVLNETTLLGLNQRKGELPKTNLPYVVSHDAEFNTHNKTIVLADSSGLRGGEADLRYTNMILTGLWEDPHINETFTITRKFAAKAYMQWISRNLLTRFNLNYEDSSELNVLSAIYYYCSTGTPADILNKRNYKAYADLGEITNIGVVRVTEVISKFEITDIDETFTFNHMVNLMRNISDDTKGKITPEVIMSTLAHSWYGEGGVFYCNLAIEYPPMFLSMLYYALVEKSYISTRFGKIVSEFAVGRKSNIGELFTRQLHGIIKDSKIKPA
ncbi:hypothetical protein TSMG0114 [Halocynthia phage JM-2012]|uniref:hypothetical protein n=1 Tax=Halocynthia phage JM-2012 TaxID=1173297 RepID=UPI00025C6946|nr:hypothetical protein TSMG0114 [Halocynthia phage JM-2012]AFI55397.1 hypothetical protein TSMG0114 [Halocynthia phage JM-2012]